MARLTLWGMQQAYPDLLEGIEVPGLMSRTDLVQIMNYRIGQLYPYCQVPPVLKELIASWFVTRKEEFQRIYDALWAEYSPIENYDRHEKRDNKITHSGTDTDKTVLGSKNTLTQTGSETSAQNVSAFDSSTYTPREQSTRTPNLSNTSENSGSDTRTLDHGHVEEHDETTHTHGNIGVTTAQQMIEAEIALRTANNMYDIIITRFEMEFISRVY